MAYGPWIDCEVDVQKSKLVDSVDVTRIVAEIRQSKKSTDNWSAL